MINRYSVLRRIILVLLLVTVIIGCGFKGNGASDKQYLLRSGDQTVSIQDYKDALAIMEAAYPHEALNDAKVVTVLKTRLLKQMTEEILLSRQAQEDGITVSDVDVENEFKAVKGEYPKDAFDKIIVERAIPLDAWKKRLKIKILIDKIINKELVATVKLTPEEVKTYYYQSIRDSNKGMNSEGSSLEKINPAFVKQLRREKALQTYPQWIDQLQKKYTVEFNQKAWNKIAG